MKQTILVTACVAAISAFTAIGASAQTTGPAPQESMKTNDMSRDGMNKDGMETKGMARDSMRKEDGMSKDMSKDGSPNANTMKNDGMKKDPMSR